MGDESLWLPIRRGYLLVSGTAVAVWAVQLLHDKHWMPWVAGAEAFFIAGLIWSYLDLWWTQRHARTPGPPVPQNVTYNIHNVPGGQITIPPGAPPVIQNDRI